MADKVAKRRRGVAAALLLVVVVGLGWFLYDSFRPRRPTEILFQQVIRDAPISDVSGDQGWEHEDVTSLICPKIDGQMLGEIGLARNYPLSKAATEDAWEVRQDKNFFAACATHSVRYLVIEIDRKTSQCKAQVQPRPFCAF